VVWAIACLLVWVLLHRFLYCHLNYYRSWAFYLSHRPLSRSCRSCACYILPEPDKQFQLVKEHVAKLRADLRRTMSRVKVYVERNLGFEAEHHHRALCDLSGVDFYVVSFFPNLPSSQSATDQ